MKLDRLTPDQWKYLAEKTHLVTFGTHLPSERVRIDFALVGTDDAGPCGYGVFKEWDAETVHWQFGGAFPGTRGTHKSFLYFLGALAYLKERYKRVTAFVENDNTVMLKFALKAGFRIQGVRVVKGQVLLDHWLEFDQEETKS